MIKNKIQSALISQCARHGLGLGGFRPRGFGPRGFRPRGIGPTGHSSKGHWSHGALIPRGIGP